MEDDKRQDKSLDKSSDKSLFKSLKATWEESEARGIDHITYINLIKGIVSGKKSKPSSFQLAFQYLIKIFDTLWTLLLILTIAVLLVVYITPITNALQTYLHDKLYIILRFTRFAFLTIHPFLLFFNIDLTQICLISNPLVNATMYCPCMKQYSPSQITDTVILNRTLINSDIPYVIRKGINTTGATYGRETLLEYMTVYNTMPSQCTQVKLGEYGPNAIDELINENKWKKLVASSESWGHMWHDCDDAPPLSSLLPKLTVNDNSIQTHPYGVYSLLTLWEKSFHYDIENDNNNASVVMILSGKVNAKLEPLDHCNIYCMGPASGILLEEGDILLYDKRYWTYNIQSWSDMSFVMKITLNSSIAQNTPDKSEL